MERPSQLRQVCQAGKMSEPGWYTIHRRISIYITWALLHTPITPTQVMFLMMGSALAGVFFLTSSHGAVNLAGFALLYLSFLFDKVDGEIARYRGVESPRAILLDRFHHLAIEPLILLAAGYHEYSRSGAWPLMLVAMVAILQGNILEEQPHLAAYALFKHMREVGRFPRSFASNHSNQWETLYRVFRSLKVFRMFITVLPALALAYAIQASTGLSCIAGYLIATAAALTIYLVFQTAYYFNVKIESEFASVASAFGSSAPVETKAVEPALVIHCINPAAGSSRSITKGRTSEPRTVSGADNETLSRVVRDHAS